MDRIAPGVCWEPSALWAQLLPWSRLPGLARWVSAELRGLRGKGQLPCAVCWAWEAVASSHHRGGNQRPREAEAARPRSCRGPPLTVEPELETRPSSAPMFFGLCPSLGVEMCRREWIPSNVSCVSDYSDSTEVKFEELKNVKLEEDDEDEEEEHEAAVLDLSVNPASLGRLVFSGSKKKSSSSLGSGSSQDSVSSDSETSEPLSCRAQGQTGVLTVHSYARGDGRVLPGEPCARKKGGATRSISERELAEVWVLGWATGGGLLQGPQWQEETLRMDLQPAVVSSKSQVALGLFSLFFAGTAFFFLPCYLYVTIAPQNGFAASLATLSGSSVERGTCSDPPGLRSAGLEQQCLQPGV